MKIFKQIKNSIYNKEYYKNTVLKEDVGASFKYLLKLSLIVAVAFAVFFAVASPFINKNFKKGVNEIIKSYPVDLKLTLNNGIASINQPEPYFIQIPNSFKELDNSKYKNKDKKIEVDNFIVINTTEPFSLDKFKSYKTLALMTKNEIILMSDTGGVKVENLSIFGNVEITKEWLQNKVNEVNKTLPWLLIGLTVLVFIGMFVIQLVVSLFSLLIYALIVWGLLKLKGIKVTYGRAYQVAIHTSTIILLFAIFSTGWDSFLLKVVILVIITYFNFDNIVKLEEEKEEIVEINKEDSN